MKKRLAVSENQLFFSAAVPCHDLIGLTDCKSMVEIVFYSHTEHLKVLFKCELAIQ